MTGQGDPAARPQQYVGHTVTPRRKKLAPDPDVRRAIVDAASKSVREQGVRGLSVATVLERARLSTRAFYRHFDSKDQLVAAVFLEMTRSEVQRLKTRMSEATDPVEAVAAWIDGRLDLAFDEEIKAELRQVSLEAQSKSFSVPDTVAPAYGAILEPLVEQLQRGLELGVFKDIIPATAAKSIHGVVWAGTQRQWATNHWDRNEVRERAVRFCLRGLGVAPHTIEELIAGDEAAS
ncbi:TetR family transcriptional regulator [Mycobacterium paraense]|jgi:AcrR family transcriptional regulator|uniref:TetR family transcriptional regulator n=1 Tax=Mycobacterium paraense TaxID=767916 RepID=A0A1X2A7B3_9MYCO|nr:TetR/AcrR family transcriptional regulator [Mycobacterium paraense]MCV7444254.1 TetR/AcrR family transcriptional regulator [Mycobacterium paraense]ORW31286.1 TetR family transcriptional regulator [Mycobacterium paraense]ORW36068.1 TetR family transcriptional regulator [Mycobacterium paraense]ORW43131.1 TetR family transcriptional regulator [Mycobacterium paraense]ORW44508.1 TetR family transcriptional regulator [Mycobacterium paraense]